MGRFITVLFLLFALAIQVQAAEYPAVAFKTSGAVFVKGSDTEPYQPLPAGTKLSGGSFVKTGANGWLLLKLSDGSTLALANNTELELATLRLTGDKREGLLSLLVGKIRASIVKLAGQQTDIRIKSRTAVAGVKGTEFLMLNKGPVNVFFGNEGRVTVAGNSDGATDLDAGTMTQTTRGHKPIAPVKVEPDSTLQKAQMVFNAATGELPPAEWTESDNLPDIIARWDINYAHYLIDKGEYGQALELLQAAFDLAANEGVRADSLLEQGSVNGRFLRDQTAALDAYAKLLSEYPGRPQAEAALYYSAQLRFDREEFTTALDLFERYLTRYPDGMYGQNARTLINRIRQELPPEPPPGRGPVLKPTGGPQSGGR
ncbi:fecR protein [Geobacter sp. OR-1]|uniref:FecR domain-containing protein n=1 Tax=Geobacter sp. OR-1 TaxID=1266765 RepID=UPI000542EAFA|nr:FecR domain-containing protein [Geobacter sp. OR-1]GAM09476.1 fecR protein [Geobacter sp. OR-1]